MRTPGSIVSLILIGAALVVGLAGCGGEDSAESAAPPPPPLRGLVSPNVLREQLRAGAALLVLDVRREADYAAGHVPRAVSLPLEGILPLGATEPTPEWRGQTAERLAQVGVTSEIDAVVVASGSRAGFMEAAAACWVLAVAGAERCHVLEGGLEAWTAARGELVRAPETPARGGPISISSEPPAWADLERVRDLTIDPEAMLVDVRDETQGETIPGSYLLPLLVTVKADGRVERVDLEARIANSGLLFERAAVVLGDDVVDGAAGWFLLVRVMGFGDVRIFPGGFQIYRTFPNLPLDREGAAG